MSASSQIFSRLQRLPFRRLDDQTFIVNPRGREVHVLNGTGSRIWDLLESQMTVEDLVHRLDREGAFDGDAQNVLQDVEAFVADLVVKGLVQKGCPGKGEEP